MQRAACGLHEPRPVVGAGDSEHVHVPLSARDVPPPAYKPGRYAYAGSSIQLASHRGHARFLTTTIPDATRRRPARQCRMAAIDTPQILAFSLSTTPIVDRRRAVSTVSRGYMALSSRMALTFLPGHQGSPAAGRILCAGSGIRTRMPFQADAFETSMYANSIIPARSAP
jgi:hypothetical protein